MNVQVLISCMFQTDTSIIQRSNIQGDVVVVNQCNEDRIQQFNFKNLKGENCKALFINTTERGLSRSRNMAIKHAWGDICVICDDDEVFFDDYIDIISSSYKQYPKADIVCMEVDPPKIQSRRPITLNFISALKVRSVTITFKLKSVKSKNVLFDEEVGSGITCAGGEENMFLYDCLKKQLKGFIIPIRFAQLLNGESRWFKGFTERYFFDRGVFTRKMMSKIGATLYAIYYLSTKRKLYKRDIGTVKAAKHIFKGIYL